MMTSRSVGISGSEPVLLLQLVFSTQRTVHQLVTIATLKHWTPNKNSSLISSGDISK